MPFLDHKNKVIPIRDKNYYVIRVDKRNRKDRWHCLSHKELEKMYLYPLSKDVPAEYWTCTTCKRQVTLRQRDEVFQEIRRHFMQKYNLNMFDFDRENKSG
jgi:hypothetical protein